ncbi:FAD-binding oxidoreductase [Pacificimonas sp. WHA3]|uniref:FAD-binding oxidoreductase n=1 Tax=Pacificimonas pallii TaxID=2827236 RepID=A0ABS6SAA2_9SPHN|nr:FAD-binding oxidoreductase [Pacificimonas pallii]MBV7255250.1 FAD-binding oxidoreductase [Pacificimonas pallii]
MTADIVIVGAGIAGASLAWHLAPHQRVVMLESESQPGVHSTGRSAAFYAETYGGPMVQPLTTASKSFFLTPPADFSRVPLVGPRGALHVAGPGSAALAALKQQFAGSDVSVTHEDRADVARHMPILAETWRSAGLWDAECRDIDVAALHSAYLTGARRRGATLLTDSELMAARRDGTRWIVDTRTGPLETNILVNAAGAWADEVARRAGVPPIGIIPQRRTMVVAAIDAVVDNKWPLTVDADGALYFKPDAGHMWISPHDEIPDIARDARPEELDVATAIHRFEQATTARVTRVVRSWAGLRSFAPDRLPVYGVDPQNPGFFWCAGQGGFGIQTAPAAAEMAAAGVLGQSARIPVDPALYAPDRFR